MSKISKIFDHKKALIAFITGGYPDIETTEDLIVAMAETGVDIIKIGIPFSDPIAEDPLLQEADKQALANGCTVDKLFAMVKKVKTKIETPLLFTTYMNSIFAYGKERFMSKCQDCGIEGVAILDLPFEEKDELADVCAKYDILQISMLAPTSKERIEMIAKDAVGFIHCMLSKDEAKTSISEIMHQIRDVSTIPCVVELGLSTPKQMKELITISDGVIISSEIIKIIVEKYDKESIEPVKQFIGNLKCMMENND